MFGLTRSGGPPIFRAYDETELVAVDRARFEELVDDHGLLVKSRVRSGVRWKELSFKLPLEAIIGVGPLARVARVMKHVGDISRLGETDRVELPNLKPRHLSALAALDRDSASRAFDALVDISVVESPAGALVIPSFQALQNYIEGLG
jgi:hypothetical protein